MQHILLIFLINLYTERVRVDLDVRYKFKFAYNHLNSIQVQCIIEKMHVMEHTVATATTGTDHTKFSNSF